MKSIPALLAHNKPWWETEKAVTLWGASMLCKRLGTGQCAALCLQHTSLNTSDGRCPEAFKVWGQS